MRIFFKAAIKNLLLCLSIVQVTALWAQESTEGQDSTVTFPAEYFSQWNPVTVADMIDRIPGVAIALDESSSGNQNNRGLGSAENILINGRRLSGKDNDARSQLDRIPFDQVAHIEIIRGTSNELVGVRNQGQIINIVTVADTQMSLTLATSMNRYQDGHTEPGGSAIINGSTTRLDYRISLERASQYQVVDTIEESTFGSGSFAPNDLRQLREITNQINQSLNSNLSYRISPRQLVTLNLQLEESDPPKTVERTILDYTINPPAVLNERELFSAQRRSWEIGADYNLSFADGSQLQLLTINNQSDQDTLRERFQVFDNNDLQDLSLENNVVNTERIYRGVYSRELTDSQGLELGLERAQTTLATDLALARLVSSGELVSVPVPNAVSEIEETRYEGFVVHNWQLNSRMRLESTLLYEISEITQTGEAGKSRDFNFLRPKLDYRFDITPSLQLRFSVEKFVAQLSFADFAANIDPRDEERDTVAGNPELRQQQSWRYTANLEYRFAEDRGVVNARLWYWDVSDAIGRVDVSQPGGPLESAAGNIGDAQVKALQINSSYRILPDLLLSGSVLARASEVIDPFSGTARRLVPNDRGFHTVGLRHDLPNYNLNYGIDYLSAPQGNRPLYDINRIDDINSREDLTLFIERNSLSSLGLVARLEISNMLDRGMCSDRFRFDDILSRGTLVEVERRCSERGTQYRLEIRGTF